MDLMDEDKGCRLVEGIVIAFIVLLLLAIFWPLFAGLRHPVPKPVRCSPTCACAPVCACPKRCAP